MNFVLDFALARLKERSTWVGIIGVLSGAGIALEPAMASLIGAAGAAIAGAVLMVTKDQKDIAEAAVDVVEDILPEVKEVVKKKPAAK